MIIAFKNFLFLIWFRFTFLKTKISKVKREKLFVPFKANYFHCKWILLRGIEIKTVGRVLLPMDTGFARRRTGVYQP